MSTQKTHDYTARHWGHDYTVRSVQDGGRVIQLSGWGLGLRAGDFILLRDQSEPGASTRYRLRSIRYERDPRDMWQAEAEFAPRT